jgi:hypothetical protein
MDKTFAWLIAIVIALGGVAVIYFHWQQRMVATTPELRTLPPPPLAQSKEPEIRYPIAQPPREPTAEPEPPLPALEDSDPALQDALSLLVGEKPMREHFMLDRIVRRVVVTIDNLPNAKVGRQTLPLQPPAGRFGVKSEGAETFISDENASRYDPYVRMLSGIDTSMLVSLYVRYYPLFQKAYEDLGYSDKYFNDRLVEVIDHLLQTPEITGPIRLVQPKVFYEFADPRLQSRSAGQKLLLRMGLENAARIKGLLRDIRAAVTDLERPARRSDEGLE